jgi:hypothetical protein
MTNVKLIAGVALAGAAGYLLFVRRTASGMTLVEDLIAPRPAPALATAGPGGLSGAGPARSSNPATTAIGVIGASAPLVGALAAAGGSTAAAGAGAVAATTGGSTAAVGTATGIGLAGTLAITGGIAGGVLLTWAVWKKGLFRGGEEALLVNPDRDQFMAQFGPPSQVTGSYETSGAHKLAMLLTEITGEPNGSHYFVNIQRADTVDEFTAAARAIQTVLAGRGIAIQAP